jgi:hypothetical protein
VSRHLICSRPPPFSLMALWMMVNQESVYGTRPWVVTNEKDIWFTKKKDADAKRKT